MKHDVYTARNLTVTPVHLAAILDATYGGASLSPDRKAELAEDILRRLGFAEPAPSDCEGANDCGWAGIVTIAAAGEDGQPLDGPRWASCREHAAPFRRMPARFVVIDHGRANRQVRG